MFENTQAMIDRNTLALASRALGADGLHGLTYSKYGIGLSLFQTPLYLIGKLLGHFAGSRGAQVAEAVTMLTNPLLMALCCAVFYELLRVLGYTRRTSLVATLILGVATSFWPYSKSDFSEPLLTLCLLEGVVCSLIAGRQATKGSGIRSALTFDALAGVALGLAVLTKYAAVIYVPGFALYMAFTLPPASPLRSVWRWTQRMVVLCVPVVVGGGGVLLVNYLRFGSILSTGYIPTDHPFNGSLGVGLFGLLLSPYRGMLFYDPLLFVGLLALPLYVLKRPRESIFPVWLMGSSLIFYGAYAAWSAGPAWGPRYLVPALPFLLLPLLELAPWWRAVIAKRDPQARRWLARLGTGLAIGLIALSGAVQALGVSVNFYIHEGYWLTGSRAFAPLVDSLRASPIATALWTLRLSYQYALFHTMPGGYAPQDYPFGPPYPLDPHAPADLGVFFVQYFWFSLLPHSAVVCLFGAAIFGLGMLFSGRTIWRRMRPLPARQIATQPTTQPTTRPASYSATRPANRSVQPSADAPNMGRPPADAPYTSSPLREARDP